MLIETTYKEGDTVSMKLSSGEEIVARLEEETDEKVKISKPMTLTATQEGFGLAPFMFTINPEHNLFLNKELVLCVVKTEDNMASQYLQNTTGLSV